MSAGSQPASWLTVTSWRTATGVSLGVPLSDLELSNFLRNCAPFQPRQFQVRLSPSTCVRLPNWAKILGEAVVDHIKIAIFTKRVPDLLRGDHRVIVPTPRTITETSYVVNAPYAKAKNICVGASSTVYCIAPTVHCPKTRPSSRCWLPALWCLTENFVATSVVWQQ